MYQYQELRDHLESKLEDDSNQILSLLKKIPEFCNTDKFNQKIIQKELNDSLLSFMTTIINVVENDINKTNNTYYDNLEDNDDGEQSEEIS